MGRIDEALKKAQRDRHRKLSAPAPAVVLSEPATGAEQTSAPGGPVLLPTAVPVSIGQIDPAVVACHDKTAVITEQYRTIRTRLLSQNPTHEHRSLAITSSVPAEGKSVTTLNLAFVLAELRHLSVLVVDGDFRRHSLARLLGVTAEPGLSEMILGKVSMEEARQGTVVENLHFIPAGALGDANAADLLSSPTSASLFEQFHEQYHYVLIDTPPATTVADVGIIGQLCDGVLLVVRMNHTPEPLVKRAVRFLRANKVNLLGCIPAGYDEQSARYPYRYRYYGYYRYSGYYGQPK
ncbi:MAG TPA: CpsD/CapB family tyrosine-protein kinase [Phycisphaerae bacterium]|nr:CpsD/CapB family tyrosine-protein kinase [Phycisphaerae bacterium]